MVDGKITLIENTGNEDEMYKIIEEVINKEQIEIDNEAKRRDKEEHRQTKLKKLGIR